MRRDPGAKPHVRDSGPESRVLSVRYNRLSIEVLYNSVSLLACNIVEAVKMCAKIQYTCAVLCAN